MPRFFDPNARVTFFTTDQPRGTVAITPQPWQALAADTDDLPPGVPPLRKSHRVMNMQEYDETDGLVHVSTLTGERHIHGETEEVHNEPGMVRVIAEDVRPQRPLDADTYQAFAAQIHQASFRLFQRQATRAISEVSPLGRDPSSIVASYLSQP